MDCKQMPVLKEPLHGRERNTKKLKGGLIMEELFTYSDIFATKA